MTHDDAIAKLRKAPWLRRAETQRTFDLLDGAQGRARVVGGVVRDTLLGRARANSEVDFATELKPEEVMARAEAANVPVIPTGVAHGTVTLKAGEMVFEVTTLRQDVETDGRHAVVRFGSDWQRDAERRDFTLNALYADQDGSLFDPLGGIGDCLAGKVRFIGDADRRIAEDRLRVYRFFRFTASHGDQAFDERGLEACGRAAADLGMLSAERIGSEMMRMLELPHVAKTLRAMSRIGVVILSRKVLRRIAQYDARTDVPLAAGRLALIMEDYAPETLQAMWRLSNAETKAALALRDAAELLAAGQVNEVAYRYADVSKTAVHVAAAMHDWTQEWQDEVTAIMRATYVPAFPIKGQDLVEAGLKPGPALGRKLHRLERDWVDSGFLLNRDELLRRVKI